MYFLILNSFIFRNHFIQTSYGIESARIADVRQELRHDSQQSIFIITYIDVSLYMPFHLWFTASQGNKDGESQQLSCLHIQPVTCLVVVLINH